MNQKKIIMLLCMIILGFFTLVGKSEKELNLGLLGGYSILLNNTDYTETGGIYTDATPTFSNKLYLELRLLRDIGFYAMVEYLAITKVTHISRYGLTPGDYSSYDSLVNISAGLRHYTSMLGDFGDLFFHLGLGFTSGKMYPMYGPGIKGFFTAGIGLKVFLSLRLKLISMATFNYINAPSTYDTILYSAFNLGVEFGIGKRRVSE